MSAPDGLSALQGKRQDAVERRRRQAPPPRHPRVVDDAPAEAVVDVRDSDAPDAAPPVPQPAEQPPEVTAEPKPAASRGRPTAARKASNSPQGDQALRPAQFYVGAEVDDYLRQVRSQAVVRRLDVTASAVVRMAMERLMAELTPEQVTDHLAEPVGGHSGAGRKRR